jgi:nucleolar complex protein 2
LQGKSGASQQKRYLASLKDKDPEFFEFLKENDQELLEFDESSSDDDTAEEGLHQPPESLEVASDDSDFEADEDDDEDSGKGRSNQVTKALLEKWSEDLSGKPSPALIGDVVQAFRSAVLTISSAETDTNKPGKKKSDAPKAARC